MVLFGPTLGNRQNAHKNKYKRARLWLHWCSLAPLVLFGSNGAFEKNDNSSMPLSVVALIICSTKLKALLNAVDTQHQETRANLSICLCPPCDVWQPVGQNNYQMLFNDDSVQRQRSMTATIIFSPVEREHNDGEYMPQYQR